MAVTRPAFNPYRALRFGFGSADSALADSLSEPSPSVRARSACRHPWICGRETAPAPSGLRHCRRFIRAGGMAACRLSVGDLPVDLTHAAGRPWLGASVPPTSRQIDRLVIGCSQSWSAPDAPSRPAPDRHCRCPTPIRGGRNAVHPAFNACAHELVGAGGDAGDGSSGERMGSHRRLPHEPAPGARSTSSATDGCVSRWTLRGRAHRGSSSVSRET